MFFGVTTLLLMVIVLVAVASDGGVVGLLAPLDELGPELLLHAAMANATMLATPRRTTLVCIFDIRQQNTADVTSAVVQA